MSWGSRAGFLEEVSYARKGGNSIVRQYSEGTWTEAIAEAGCSEDNISSAKE